MATANINAIVSQAKADLATTKGILDLPVAEQGPALEKVAAFFDKVLKQGLQEGYTIGPKRAQNLMQEIFVEQRGSQWAQREAELTQELVNYLKPAERWVTQLPAETKILVPPPKVPLTPEAEGFLTGARSHLVNVSASLRAPGVAGITQHLETFDSVMAHLKEAVIKDPSLIKMDQARLQYLLADTYQRLDAGEAITAEAFLTRAQAMVKTPFVPLGTGKGVPPPKVKVPLTPEAEKILKDAEEMLGGILEDPHLASMSGMKPIIDEALRKDAVAKALEPLTNKLLADPSLVKIGTVGAQQIVLQTHVLQAAGKFDQVAFEKIVAHIAKRPFVPPVAGQPPTGQAPKPEEAQEAADAAKAGAKKGVFKIILDHPRSAAGITAGVTALTAVLWPNKKEEVPKEDGTTEIKKHWSGMKKAVVTVGVIIPAAILAHYGYGKWANKVATEKLAGAAAKAMG